MPSFLISGATGFVGWHVAAELLRRGNEVHLVVRPPADRDSLRTLPGQPQVHVCGGTAADTCALVKRIGPDAIFHLASHVLADHTTTDIDQLITSNVLFGTQLIDAALRNGVPRFINTGSFFQHHRPGVTAPVSLYAATKQAFEEIVRYYASSGRVRTITLKLFDTYGPNDRRRKLLRLLVEASEPGVEFVLAMSPGEQLLHLVHVADVVRAFIHADALLATRPDAVNGLAFAVDSDAPLSVRHVVELFERVTGRRVRAEWGGRPYREREVMVPWAGERLPGWSPEIDLRAGLQSMLSKSSF